MWGLSIHDVFVDRVSNGHSNSTLRCLFANFYKVRSLVKCHIQSTKIVTQIWGKYGPCCVCRLVGSYQRLVELHNSIHTILSIYLMKKLSKSFFYNGFIIFPYLSIYLSTVDRSFTNTKVTDSGTLFDTYYFCSVLLCRHRMLSSLYVSQRVLYDCIEFIKEWV